MHFPKLSTLGNVVFVAALLASSAALRADSDDSAVSQINDAKARLQLTHISQTDKDSLSQTIADLMGRANELDNLRIEVVAKTQEANGAKSDYESASDTASTLRQKADDARQTSASRRAAIIQQASGICGQLGGSFDGSTCEMRCQEDGECSQKHSSWESQVAPLRSELSELQNNLQSSEQDAAAAEADENAKLATWQNAQSVLKPLVAELEQKLPQFQRDLASLNNLLAQAEKTPLAIHLGPAYRQAQAVSKGMNARDFSCFDDMCSDVGANPDGTLVAPPAPPAAVTASMPKFHQLQSDLQSLTSQYNDIRQKLQQAIATKDPSMGTLDRQLTSVHGKLEFTAYQLNSLKATHSYAGPPMAEGPAN